MLGWPALEDVEDEAGALAFGAKKEWTSASLGALPLTLRLRGGRGAGEGAFGGGGAGETAFLRGRPLFGAGGAAVDDEEEPTTWKSPSSSSRPALACLASE